MWYQPYFQNQSQFVHQHLRINRYNANIAHQKVGVRVNATQAKQKYLCLVPIRRNIQCGDKNS